LNRRIIKAMQLLLLSGVAASAVTMAGTSRFAGLDGTPGLRSASAIVTDTGGNIIYSKDEHAVRPIASITKLMTAMVVLDAHKTRPGFDTAYRFKAGVWCHTTPGGTHPAGTNVL
jgi:D-alanyl-D-alanine carboxypeptidase